MAVRKWGPEQIVNTTQGSGQFAPSVAALAGGGWVVAWRDASGNALTARYQVFAGDGTAMGPERVVPLASASIYRPVVVGLSDGGFTIAVEAQTASSGRDVLGYRFDAAGANVGSFDIAASGADQRSQAVAPMDAGFATIYEEDGDLWFQGFDAGGAPAFERRQVEAGGTPGLQVEADLAYNGGTLLMAWRDVDANAIRAAHYDPGGNLLYPALTVASPNVTGWEVNDPEVTALRNGRFVLTWSQEDFGALGTDIKAQLFDPAGQLIGNVWTVNTAEPAGSQFEPEVLGLRGGGFAVVWIDQATSSVRGQAFDGGGRPLGAEFVASSSDVAETLGNQVEELSVAELADGRLVVTWIGADSDGLGVFQQVIDPREGVVNGTAGADKLWGSDAWGDEVNGLGGADRLWGMRGDDDLRGGSGDDSAYGGRGDDLVVGYRGNDLLVGGRGADELWGGDGTDAAGYAAGGPVTVALDRSLAALGDAAGDILSGIEALVGSDSADRLRGDAGANRLSGGAGADRIEGMDGDDRLLGGAGADLLSGEAGQDGFVFLATAESGPGAALRDRLSSFVSGQDDIVVSAIDAVAGGGDDAFVLDAGGSFVMGEIRQLAEGANLRVLFNTEGGEAAEMEILVLGRTAPLLATDFAL